ncbi:uncharacterized protein LOC106509717 isoform X2 [Sus scrofa]|uniref:uncharacterized protein LOC106509717 isoform X2 n=1 Tax=Sus scrofa TaxID=9823 RepID=UPI000A2B3597|nr:uncharacterized protein LOC106509717 isoform X2 [Sus scrofa]
MSGRDSASLSRGLRPQTPRGSVLRPPISPPPRSPCISHTNPQAQPCILPKSGSTPTPTPPFPHKHKHPASPPWGGSPSPVSPPRSSVAALWGQQKPLRSSGCRISSCWISQCGFAQIWVEMHQRVDTFLQNLFEDNMQVAGHHPLLSPPGWGKDGLSEELLGAFDTQLENDDDSVELALMKLEDGLSEDLLGAFDAQLENDDSGETPSLRVQTFAQEDNPALSMEPGRRPGQELWRGLDSLSPLPLGWRDLCTSCSGEWGVL